MTKIIKSGWKLALFVVTLSTTLLPIRAAAQDGDERDDPPTRVARLGYIEGSVLFRPAGMDDWERAIPNRPMTTGDQLWVDDRARAELQLGSVVIRLSEGTSFSFLNLDDHTVQIQLSSGSISFRVRRLDQDDYFEVDTPSIAFAVSQPGNYRLNVNSQDIHTGVIVREGAAQATGGGRSYALYAGQMSRFSGTGEMIGYAEPIRGYDPFDDWSNSRDRRYDDSPSARYLSREVVGFQDLDDYGDWRDDPTYGHVWFPRVESGWAPYHNGHWEWIDPWGYTWVDESPWGYAPFHYGRWVSASGRWGWVAGPANVRPVYAPALVVFMGGGGRSLGGNVAWFPLGPREVYVPPYQVSRGYMNRVNVSNTTVNTTTVTNVYNTTVINKTVNITNVTYVNKVVPGAVVAVPRDAFAGARPVARAAVPVSAQQVASAEVSQRAAVVPTHQSGAGGNAPGAGHVAAPPAAVINRQVVANRTPPPPPVSFAAKQQMLAAHPGQPLQKTELQSIAPAGNVVARPMVKVMPAGKPVTPAAGGPGNLPPNANRMPQGNPPATEAHPGAPVPPNRPQGLQPVTPVTPAEKPGMQQSPPVPQPMPAVIPKPPTPRPVAPEFQQARPVTPPPAAAKPVQPPVTVPAPAPPPPVSSRPVQPPPPPPMTPKPTAPEFQQARPVTPPPAAAKPVQPPVTVPAPTPPPPASTRPVQPPPPPPVTPRPTAPEFQRARPVTPPPAAGKPVQPPATVPAPTPPPPVATRPIQPPPPSAAPRPGTPPPPTGRPVPPPAQPQAKPQPPEHRKTEEEPKKN